MGKEKTSPGEQKNKKACFFGQSPELLRRSLRPPQWLGCEPNGAEIIAGSGKGPAR